MAVSEMTRLQLQQSVETYRTQLSLLVQICTVLTVADGTIIGYAVSQKLAGVLWAGLIFPLTMMLVIRFVIRSTVPVLAVAINIEARCADPDVGGLVSTFVSATVSSQFLTQIRAAVLADSETERARLLGAALRDSYSFAGGRLLRKILLLVAILQIISPIFLWRWAHWNLLYAGDIGKTMGH